MKCTIEGKLVDVVIEKSKEGKDVPCVYVYSDREVIRIPNMQGKKEDIGKNVDIPIYERIRTYNGEMYRSILPVKT